MVKLFNFNAAAGPSIVEYDVVYTEQLWLAKERDIVTAYASDAEVNVVVLKESASFGTLVSFVGPRFKVLAFLDNFAGCWSRA